MNTDWALAELNRFLALVEYRDKPGLYAATYVGSEDEINAQNVVVERIWEKDPRAEAGGANQRK